MDKTPVDGDDSHGPLAYFAELLVYKTDKNGVVIPGAERQWESDLSDAEFKDLLERYPWVRSIAAGDPDADDSPTEADI
ncbi:MAG: hypothetical protein M3077_12800 [Candidatus Dormibacteraeota bacterium]|nr:hypothetical protein [Candidatus Dormibacteraeota bacterium]